MLKLAYKVGSRGGAMVSTSARKAGDPWFESRSWYDRFLYVNIHLFIYIYIYISHIYIYIYYIYNKEDSDLAKWMQKLISIFVVHIGMKKVFS